MRPELAGVECPALIVQGTEDEYATEDHARDIADWIERAELWLEPGADHVLPQAMPEVFNARVLDFLAKHCG
jgi:pimeloyl-ACP methyl ester carboxylesterase